MSATEVIVVAVGLFVGYWVVSKLIADRPAPTTPDAASPADEAAAAPIEASWYEVLEVSPKASADEIRGAYKRLMNQYHPDKVASLGAELRTVAGRKSKEITAAYRSAMAIRRETG